jgi:hypothetical protein
MPTTRFIFTVNKRAKKRDKKSGIKKGDNKMTMKKICYMPLFVKWET